MNISMWDHYIQMASDITDHAFQGIASLADWKRRRPQLYREFMRSMALDPLPPKCDLNVQVAGELKGRGFHLQKLFYRILPDCWASANLYYPDPRPAGKLPAVLFACGHSAIGIHGYQKNAILWTRRGYICLVFDTIEQHDNPGEHHGLISGRRPDWVSMGYTAAGGELWNSIRALDVLCACPEVDAGKIGATGASGGGAHSFYLAVADERIRALASCCGVTLPKYTLDRQHLLTHCDCMYYHNFFQRDMSEFAALIAPRPALFCYGSRDYLFSREEYTALVAQMKKVYRMYGAAAACKLSVHPGPHGYRPACVAAANAWFDKHLAGARRPARAVADNELAEKAISVFNGRPPSPNRLKLLPELLCPDGAVGLPQNQADWRRIKKAAKQALAENVFHLIKMRAPLAFRQLGDWFKGPAVYRKYRGALRENEVWLETYTPAKNTGYVCVGIVNHEELARPMLLRLCDHAPGHTLAIVVPRFCGFNHCADQQRHLLRAGCLTGMTPFMLTLQDVFGTVPALRNLAECRGKKVIVYGRGAAGISALYYALFDEAVAGVVLEDGPATHRQDAFIPGILKVMDIQHAIGLMAPRKIGLVNTVPPLWARRAYERLDCADRLITGVSLKSVMEKMV